MTRRTATAALLGALAAPAQTPVSAEAILNQAGTEASRSHRIIFADFAASW